MQAAFLQQTDPACLISVPGSLAVNILAVFPDAQWNSPDVSAQIIKPVVTALILGKLVEARAAC